MNYRTRKLIKPEDLNAGNTLFGGRLALWIDEEAAIYTMCQLDTKHIVTKTASFNFLSPAKQGDIIEIGVEVIKFGRTSITLHVIARNKENEQVLCEITDMVFVSVNEEGRPMPHGKKEVKKEG